MPDRKARVQVPIVISMGDPHGVGPETILKSLTSIDWDSIRPIVVGDPGYFRALANDLDLELPFHRIEFIRTESYPYPPKWGVLDRGAGGFALRSLVAAVEQCRERRLPVLVTAPINKRAAQKAGMRSPGQTELVASFFPHSRPAMAFFSDKFHLLLATVHIPLRRVFTELTTPMIVEKGTLFHRALSEIGSRQPRIAVCGLNPHASEDGLFGDEEARIIAPAVCRLNEILQAEVFVGPLPADTVFKLALEKRFDGVVAMYHDQGLAPLKVAAFTSSVNATLGLPIIRTSPAHGTAFDLAGKGRADARSMRAAIRWGILLASARRPG